MQGGAADPTASAPSQTADTEDASASDVSQSSNNENDMAPAPCHEAASMEAPEVTQVRMQQRSPPAMHVQLASMLSALVPPRPGPLGVPHAAETADHGPHSGAEAKHRALLPQALAHRTQ